MRARKISALILAAGFSSRLEGFKPLLQVGGQTFLARAIGLFHLAGIEDIVTVVGHRAHELLPVVQGTASRHVFNVLYHDGMFSSVQTGLRALRDAGDAFFLLPVDIPLVRPSTVRKLVDAFYRHSAPPVCYPRFQSRRGHPPLINTGLTDQILNYDVQGGLRGLLRSYDDQAIDINVGDPFIRLDVDTREDLMVLRKKYSQYGACLKR